MTTIKVSHHVPASIVYSFIDADPIAYAGACAAEKVFYKFINKRTGDETEEFPSAKDAAVWLSDLSTLGYDEDPTEWERQSFKKVSPESMAISLTKSVYSDYIASSGGAKEIEGFLTQRGVKKSKDILGLENRYQGGRENLETPTHLEACRDWLLRHSNFHTLKGGFEADAIVISKSEKRGRKAMLLSIDKDLQQAEETFILNMKYERKDRSLWIAEDGLGKLWECPIKKKIVGVGFKWLMLQAMAGDRADGYFGIKGYGDKSAKKLIDQYDDRVTLLKAMLNLYEDKFQNYTYTSWDGQVISKTPYEMMEQHIWLAYQERSPKDSFKLSKYL